MSIQEKIATLQSLSVIDARILEIRGQLDVEQVAIDDKVGSHRALAGRAAQLEAQISAMEKTRSELMGELRQTSVQLDRSREKMNRCRNEKEANAVSRELEEIRRIVRDRESELQKLAGIVDEARADLERINVELSDIGQQIDSTSGDATSRVSELRGSLTGLEGERAGIASKLDGLTLRRYEAVRKKRGSGIAAAMGGSCTACYISLPPMLFQRLTMGHELIECPSCHRILYHQPAVATDADSSSSS